MAADLQNYYAPEVEEALVTLVWHKPEHLARVLRELDPEVHLTQFNLRLLLGAISDCYREAGSVDWALVIEWFKDFKKLDDVGGKEALNSLYTNYGYESLLDFYLVLLKDFASHREFMPGQHPAIWSGGKAQLVPNKTKSRDFQPDFVGPALIAGKSYRVLAKAEPGVLTLRFYPQ